MSVGAGAERATQPHEFRIGGIAPRAIATPKNRDELCEVLRGATRDRLAIVPWGGGVSLSLEPAPARYDLAIDLDGLDRVVEYEPQDVTITAECGVPIAALRELLAARGQELPLEAPHAERATLGGALAANASGPRRLRFGSPRDRILGARFVLADGTLVHTGGKVVKNVAGYGIHRLLCGSRGGLAILVEASLKLATAPATRLALVYRTRAAELADVARFAFLPRLEPALVTVLGGEAAGAIGLSSADREPLLVVGLEDDAAWVARQAALVTAALGAPAQRFEGADAVASWQRLADLEEGEGARLTFTTATNTPAALAPLAADAIAARMVFHAPAGRLHLFPGKGSDSAALVERLAEHRFTLIGAAGVPGIAPALPPMAATLALRSRIREALDPMKLMALGEVWERGGG